MRYIDWLVAPGLLYTALATTACESMGGLLVEKNGIVPTAEARVLDHPENPVMIDFEGQAVEVKLDGSQSIDPDGHIVTYRWLAWKQGAPAADGGTASADGGVAWIAVVPDGQSPGWPSDVAQPTVQLGEGTFVFTLWVIDDRGNTSAPASVQVQVSSAQAAEAQAQVCIQGIADNASETCAQCVCHLDDMCRAAIATTACDETCWNLLGCIASKCPEFTPGGDTSCLTTNCGDFLSGGAAARALTPCLTGSCSAACASMP